MVQILPILGVIRAAIHLPTLEIWIWGMARPTRQEVAKKAEVREMRETAIADKVEERDVVGAEAAITINIIKEPATCVTGRVWNEAVVYHRSLEICSGVA